MTAAEELLYTTVRIVTRANGAPIQSGTGFFWRIQEGSGRAFLLVTNKHVLNGADEVTIICNGLDEESGKASGQPALVDISITTPPFHHPDPDVDLAAIGFNEIMDTADRAGTPLFIKALDRHMIPDQSQWETFDAIEEVLMIGCPRGIYDEVNRIPIVRRGVTATPLNWAYQGKQEFLVDIACFPGSSGSPVFIFNQGGFSDRSGYHVGATRLFFVGILHAGPVIDNEGKIVLGHQPKVQVATMMHLGQVIKATEVLDLEIRVRAHLAAERSP